MKLRQLTPFIALLFVYSSNKAQLLINTRFGINTLNEVNLEVLSSTMDKFHLYTSMSYFHRSYNYNGSGCGTPWPNSLFDNENKGIGLEMGLTFNKTKIKKNNKEKHHQNTIAIIYRRFEGELNINESGCGELIRDYEFVAHDFGFSYYKDFNVNNKTSFYWNFGMLSRVRKQKLIFPISSNPMYESKNQPRFILDIGFRINLVKLDDQRK